MLELTSYFRAQVNQQMVSDALQTYKESYVFDEIVSSYIVDKLMSIGPGTVVFEGFNMEAIKVQWDIDKQMLKFKNLYTFVLVHGINVPYCDWTYDEVGHFIHNDVVYYKVGQNDYDTMPLAKWNELEEREAEHRAQLEEARNEGPWKNVPRTIKKSWLDYLK